jgi:hypothetical protein
MFEHFGSLLKGSLWTLPWIFLLPLAAITLEVSVFNRDGINFTTVDSNEPGIWGEETWGLDEDDYANNEFDIPDEKSGMYSVLALGRNLIAVLLLAAIAVNFLLLLFIPCSFGGLHPAKKKVQFYTGFFINLGLMLAAPLLFRSLGLFFYMAPGYFFVMLLLFCVAYLVPFVAGSRFVARAFRKAFWFW